MTHYAIARSGGFSADVTVTVEKPTPFDATLSLTPATLSGTGTYSLRVRFISGSLVREQLVTVTVSKH